MKKNLVKIISSLLVVSMLATVTFPQTLLASEQNMQMEEPVIPEEPVTPEEPVIPEEPTIPEDSEQEKVESISLNKTSIVLQAKKSTPLKATIYPKSLKDQKIKWKSSNKEVVKVTTSGKVVAMNKGVAYVTATAVSNPDVSVKCKVTVRNKLVTGIQLTASSKRLAVGKTYQIGVKSISPSNADIKSFSYTSSNPKIATVDSKGKVTAKKAGLAEITVAAKDGSGKKATINIFVRKYVRDAKYYPIYYAVSLPSGGYNVSTKNIGLKVIYINKKLLGSTSASYTSSTKNAVIKFQKKKGLKQTGVVDKKTWLAMGYSENDWYNLAAYKTPITTDKNSSKQDYINRMLEVAKKYADKKTPYRIGCSGKPGTYVDCSGLIYQCLYSIGINPKYNIIHHGLAKYEYTSYYLAKDAKLGPSISRKNIKAGDLVFYCRNGGSTVCHVAIYAGNGKIYDAWPGIGTTKRSINIPGYRVCKIIRVIE